MIRTAFRRVAPMAALLAFGGCAYQTQAQINAGIARHIGQSEPDLVRELGVPNRHFESGGHRFLAYLTGHQEILSSGGDFGYGGFGGGYGYGGGWGGLGWGWGGGYGGFGGGWGFPSDIVSYGCQTTFEIAADRVAAFTRHGNDCREPLSP